MDELVNQFSAFELAELQTIYVELANSTLTIFISALFAYLIFCHVALDRLAKGQLIVVTSLYSFFMLVQIALLVLHWDNTILMQDRMSTLFSNVPPGNAFYFVVPALAFAFWVISILYMLSVLRRKDT